MILSRLVAISSLSGAPYGVIEYAVWMPLRVFEQLARFARSLAGFAYVLLRLVNDVKPLPNLFLQKNHRHPFLSYDLLLH